MTSNIHLVLTTLVIKGTSMAKEIVLLRGEIATVDDDDYEGLFKYKWRRSHWGYVIRSFLVYEDGKVFTGKKKRGRKGKQKVIWMHRQIMGFPKEEVDHVDGNPLNNQKNNLRLCSSAQNKWNQRKRKGIHSSKYKGVRFDKRAGKGKPWTARITINYVEFNLGQFETEEDAARAYDKEAFEQFGGFARLNFSQ